MPDLQPSRSPCCIRLETSPEKDAAEAEGTIKRTRHIASGGCCRCTSFLTKGFEEWQSTLCCRVRITSNSWNCVLSGALASGWATSRSTGI